jgi:hypothetical protein
MRSLPLEAILLYFGAVDMAVMAVILLRSGQDRCRSHGLVTHHVKPLERRRIYESWHLASRAATSSRREKGRDKRETYY